MTVEDVVHPKSSPNSRPAVVASSAPNNPQHQSTNSPQPLTPLAGTTANASSNVEALKENVPHPLLTFEKYLQSHPARATKYINQVKEVTSINDVNLIIEAFNRTRSESTRNFDVPGAIEWVLDNQSFVAQKEKKRPLQLRLDSGGNTEISSTMAPAVAMNRPEVSGAPPNSPNQTKPLVDLTDNGNKADNANNSAESDIQRAIKLSLQDAPPGFVGSSFSREEEDVSRALEASLMESTLSSSKRKRGDAWIDPLNPHERERSGMWPVGLKNVGQTCWFSAVIQSLFHLPAFRNLVLNFQPLPVQKAPPNGLKENLHIQDDLKERRFVTELRYLFALMMASERKYVDPSNAIDIFRGSTDNTANDNKQEDVSEFTFSLFEWMERAFKNPGRTGAFDIIKEEKMEEGEEKDNRIQQEKQDNMSLQTQLEQVKDSNKNEDDEAEQENPIAKLFYGRIQVEGSNSTGGDFVCFENFTLHSLHVNESSNIHDSLEKGTASQTVGSASSQERWFTELPPVLLFSLTRYGFDKDKKMAEKIHHRFEFPDTLYMDRYMDVNKNVTRDKREQVRVLKKQLDDLHSKLQKYTHYGNAETKMPLQSILQATMDYAFSGTEDISMASPPENPNLITNNAPAVGVAPASLMQVDSPCPSPKMTPGNSVSNLAAMTSAPSATGNETSQNSKDDSNAMDVEMREEEEVCEEIEGCDDNKAVSAAATTKTANGPFPSHISELELRVIQTCLSRWKTEVESEIYALEKNIQTIDEAIMNMYSEESLMKREYRLHAVLVHEGSMNSGHYWAYVFDHKKKGWLKFNDNSVTDADWNELQRESFGGSSSASAYSLVYLETAKAALILDSETAEAKEDDKMEQEGLEYFARILPNDLSDYVRNDNNLFVQERLKWDAEQEQRKKDEEMAKLQAEALSEGGGGELEVLQEKLTYVNSHAKISATVSLNAIKKHEQGFHEKSVSSSTLDLVIRCAKRFYEEKKDLECTDVRLESFVIFLIKNNCPDRVVNLALLEQFSLPGLDNESQFASAIRQLAETKLKMDTSLCPIESEVLKEWHQAYHNYRVSANCFVHGLEAFLELKFEEALDLLTLAYNKSISIFERPPIGKYKTLVIKHLLKYLRMAVIEVNQVVISLFKSGDDLPRVRKVVDQLIVPALYIFQSRVNRESSEQPNSYLSNGTVSAKALEDIRIQWCSLLGGESEANAENSQAVSDLLTVILEPPEPKHQRANPRGVDHIDQPTDLSLADRYQQTMKKLHDFKPTAVS